MTRKEAVLAMLEGKKVCGQLLGSYMYFDKDEGFIYRNWNGDRDPIKKGLGDDFYTLYEEKFMITREIFEQMAFWARSSKYETTWEEKFEKLKQLSMEHES